MFAIFNIFVYPPPSPKLQTVIRFSFNKKKGGFFWEIPSYINQHQHGNGVMVLAHVFTVHKHTLDNSHNFSMFTYVGIILSLK